MARDKTVVIVFPPFNTPTSPPLGAAMLKGFVERELPDWRVKVLDLNVWAFERLLGLLEAGEFSLDPETFEDPAGAARDLLAAAAAFRGKSPEAFFDRPDLYNRFGEVFLGFTETYTKLLNGVCDAFETGGKQAPIVQEMLDVILAEKPAVVGFSMIFSNQLPVGALLGKLIRKRHGLPVVFGGSCFADAAEHFLKWYPDSADMVIAGEGEDALKQLLIDFTAPDKVPGAVYFDNHHSIRKVDKAYSKSIDFYGAPDFSDTDLKRYYSPEPIVPLLLSRGCYWRRCTFCVHYRSAGLTYRMHSMDFTIEMLRGFVAQGIRHFAFIDEMISPPHFVRLARAIKEAGLDIAYYALTKPNAEFTSEHLLEMAESGCKYLLWGLESGNQRVLDLMDKGTKIEDVSKVLKRAYAAGIYNHVFMICGFPTETEAEFAQTIKFLEDHKDYIYAVHRGVFGLEPESPIFEDQARFGITRSWMVKDTPTGGRWGYDVSSGMSQHKAAEVFTSALPFLREFNPYARFLGNFRDHALIVYDRRGTRLRPQLRRFPPIQFRNPPPAPWADGGVSERSLKC
jgi:anaerobic magnesium-protoporphyrin IX monomethyl ester cyclase